MIQLRFLLFIPLLLSACSNQPTMQMADSKVFCDRYLLYRMCAIDVFSDGQTDFVYFEDSQQIFLFDQQLLASIPAFLSLHECAQSMDDPLINATSALLTVNDEMGFLRRAEIKNNIFYHYMRYIPRINRCNRTMTGNDEDSSEDFEDDFGVAENEEFGYQ